MTDELYIDGQRADLRRGDDRVELVYQSPLLTDVEDVVSNHTMEITLPLTANNIRILGYARTQAEVTFPFRKHTAEVRRGGMTILAGDVILLGHDEGGLSLSVVWGNEQTWKKLDDVSLRDLQDWESEEDYINIPKATDEQRTLYKTLIDYGKGRFDTSYWLPALRVEDIVDRIEAKAGVSIGDVFDEFVIALGTKATADEGREWESVRTGVQQLGAISQSADSPGWVLYFGNKIVTDRYGLIQSTNLWRFLTNDNGVTSAKVSLPVIEIVQTGRPGGDVMRYQVFGYTGTAWRSLWTAPSAMQRTQLGTDRYKYVGEAVESDDIDTSGCQYIVVAVTAGYIQAYEAIESVMLSDNVVITPNPDSVWQYPLYYNLPDMTCGEFVKQLMKTKGLYADCDEDSVSFASIDTLYENIAQSRDWTDKVVDWRRARYEYTLDGMARRNWLRYAGTDDVAEGSRDWHIDVDNENLEEQDADIVTLDLGTLDGGYRMPVYETDENGNVTFRETEARLMRKSEPDLMRLASVNGLDWKTITETYYSGYKEIVRQPVVVTADVLLTMYDQMTLDMLTPVYLRQTGRFYGLQTLTMKSDGLAEARLVEVPVRNEDIERPFTLDVSELDGNDRLN